MSSIIVLDGNKTVRDTKSPVHEALYPICNIQPSPYFRWKIWLDRTLAALLLIPFLPVIVFLALLIRLTSPGRAIFHQKRVGKNGKVFILYKLRSMRQDAEAATGAAWSAVNDPRVTYLGHILRKFHLDELPQLFNVLKGEMSLVGPRPERPEFIYHLSREIAGYQNRLVIPPGITGLAQLNLPPDNNINDVRNKLLLDVEYVKRASLSMDVRLLLSTFLRMFKLSSKYSLKLLGVERSALIPDPDPSSKNGSEELNGYEMPVSVHSLVTAQRPEKRIPKEYESANGDRSSHKTYQAIHKPK